LILAARAPYAADALLRYLARRAIAGVEETVDGVYRRSLRLTRGAGVVELAPAPGGMRAELDLDDERDEPEALAKVSALLDLDADAPAIAAVLGRDALLGPHVRAEPGRRVPGTVDGPELAFRAVLGQQISLAAAATHAARLVAAAGEPLARPRGTVTHTFPSPAAVAAVPDAVLAMPATRRRTIRALASALADGGSLAPEALLPLPGIGPWTASYVAMRALHDPDAYLPTDLGVKHALARLGHDGDSERWRPWRAYAVLHLWGTLAT
jgi:AraC family transcriptional regulator, regulatory protein of adaptative response / DNA-3-methyladenine glycosylase II